jgi:hypothetical protein
MGLYIRIQVIALGFFAEKTKPCAADATHDMGIMANIV